MRKLYNYMEINGELAARTLNDKALCVYDGTDPLDIYEVDKDNYSIRGVLGDIDNLSFKELEEYLELNYEEDSEEGERRA